MSVKYRTERRGFLWPIEDIGASKVVFDSDDHLEWIYSHCRGFDAAIQAGGNCGVYPMIMGDKFKYVYTFEPDPTNFRCLCANAPAENVFKFNAALGDKRGCVDMLLRPENCGAHQTAGVGAIPTLMIDDLALEKCDLICLDIEGDEFAALHGAALTIERCRPTIVIEEKGLAERYGVAKGGAEDLLVSDHGYRVAARFRRDIALVPND